MKFDRSALVAKYGEKNLRLATATDSDGEEFQFVLKKPSRAIVQALNACQGNEEKAEKILIKNCIVEGDMEALDDAEVYIGILEQCGKLFKKANVELKKF